MYAPHAPCFVPATRGGQIGLGTVMASIASFSIVNGRYATLSSESFAHAMRTRPSEILGGFF